MEMEGGVGVGGGQLKTGQLEYFLFIFLDSMMSLRGG